MRFGAHAFVWTGNWDSNSARKVINGAAAAGLDFVEIALLRPQEFDPAETKALLDEKELGSSYSLGLPADASLPERPDEAEAFLGMAIEKVAAAGSDILTGVIYGTLGELPGRPPREADYDVIARSLERVSKKAKQHGVRLGIEPVNRYETYLVNTVDQGVQLIERIGAENLFLHPDTYHMNIEEESFAEALRTGGSHVQYIHLSESHRGTPGRGTVNWESVFEGLRDIDYRGDLVMESFAALNQDIARATCIWREIVSDPARLVEDGLAFLRDKADRYGLQ